MVTENATRRRARPATSRHVNLDQSDEGSVNPVTTTATIAMENGEHADVGKGQKPDARDGLMEDGPEMDDYADIAMYEVGMAPEMRDEDMMAVGDEGDIFGHGGDLDQAASDGIDGDKRAAASDQDRRHNADDVCAQRPRAYGALDADGEGLDCDDYNGNEGARANDTGICVVGAREGPGGPHLYHSTAAVATVRQSVVTDAVVEGCEGAALLHLREKSRKASADRGKAAPGPPSGGVGPLESSMNMAKRRRGMNFPQESPPRPEAGSGNQGLAADDENGERPADEESERRRDGTDYPARCAAAARYGDVAAVPREREVPESGTCLSHVQHARELECQRLPQTEEQNGGMLEPSGDGRETRATECTVDKGCLPAATSASASGRGARGPDQPERDGRPAVDLRADAQGPRAHEGLHRQEGRRNARAHNSSVHALGDEERESRGRRGHRHGSESGSGAHDLGSSGCEDARGGANSAWGDACSSTRPNLHEGSQGAGGPLARDAAQSPAAPRHQRPPDDRARAVRHGGCRDALPAGRPASRAASTRGPSGGGDGLHADEGADWIFPWQKEPSWLYLPHIVHENRVKDDSADMLAATKRRRVGAAIGAGSAHAARQAADDQEEQSRGVHGIRGRALPGASGVSAEQDDFVVAPGATSSTTSIRGLGVEPGPSRDDRERRAQERLDARNSHLRRSLDDHAERVSKRRSQRLHEEPGQSAAERMSALRRRVAERSARTRGDTHVGGAHGLDADLPGGGEDGARSPGDVQCAAGSARGHIPQEGGALRRLAQQTNEASLSRLVHARPSSSSTSSAVPVTACTVAASQEAWHIVDAEHGAPA